MQYVRVVSQSGGSFTFTNPWSGNVEVYRNGTDTGTVSGSQVVDGLAGRELVQRVVGDLSTNGEVAQDGGALVVAEPGGEGPRSLGRAQGIAQGLQLRADPAAGIGEQNVEASVQGAAGAARRR